MSVVVNTHMMSQSERAADPEERIRITIGPVVIVIKW